MASVKLYLDTRVPRKDGTYPLKLVVTHKQPFMVNLKIYLRKEQWESGTIIDPKVKRLYGQIIEQRLINVKKMLLTLDMDGKLKSLSPKQLKDKIEFSASIEQPDVESPYLFKVHITKYIANKTNPRTKELYSYTLNKIKEFTDIETLTFEDMNFAWMKSFDSFMSSTCELNTRSIHFRNIRSVFNDAIDEELISQNIYPFRKFKIKKEATIKRSLTVDQLIMLRDYPCEEYLEKYRDFFMLIFYLIGINIIDLLHLTEIRNNSIIEYRRAKTGRLYTIKVQPEAKAIFEKYKGENYLLDVLDVYANYKDFTHRFNMNLKKIGPVTIGKKGKKTLSPLFPELTSYYARHTWATIAAALDIPKETIAAALGHGGNTVTDIYIDFDQRKVNEANRKILDYLNETKAKHDIISSIMNGLLNKKKKPANS